MAKPLVLIFLSYVLSEDITSSHNCGWEVYHCLKGFFVIFFSPACAIIVEPVCIGNFLLIFVCVLCS